MMGISCVYDGYIRGISWVYDGVHLFDIASTQMALPEHGVYPAKKL